MKKLAKKNTKLNPLRRDNSAVKQLLYLIRSKERLEIFISLLYGAAFGGIYPVASYILWHKDIWEILWVSPEDVLKGLTKILIGISGVIVSLTTVRQWLSHMMRKEGLVPLAAAILLEGVAMATQGWLSVVALLAIVFANTVKMSYNSLLPKEKEL